MLTLDVLKIKFLWTLYIVGGKHIKVETPADDDDEKVVVVKSFFIILDMTAQHKI